MSIYVPDSWSALGAVHAVAASWRSAAGFLLHRALDRPRHLLIAWQVRQRDRSDLRRLQAPQLRDIGLTVEDLCQERDGPLW